MDFSLISKVELINEDEESTLGIIQDKKDNKIYVSITVSKDKFTLLRAGDMVRGIITDQDQVLAFNGLVNRRIHGELPMYEIIYSDLEKIQRREDFRMECSIPLKFTRDSENFMEGLIADISGGGLRLVSNEKMDRGTELLFNFKLNRDHMSLKGEIVHRSDNSSASGLKYAYGVKFIDISEATREGIIRNIFSLMRERIRK